MHWQRSRRCDVAPFHSHFIISLAISPGRGTLADRAPDCVNPFLKHLSLAFLMTAFASADGVHYEGRLSVNGVPFNGTGRFKFALVGEQGSALWSSGEISLTVSDGVYAVRLGESAQAPPISAAVLRGTPPPRLRIWFHRGGKGWALASADVRLTGSQPVNPAKPQ
jgi:hypothetical protein